MELHMVNFVPKPQGLQANGSITCSLYNGQIRPYLIKSGYNQNIFSGDPVIIAGEADASGDYTGYLISAYDAGAGDGAATPTTPILGVFQGCSYIQPSYANPVDPASPGRPFWPAGTVTVNNVPAVAFVIVDPNVVYRVLCDSPTGVSQEYIGQTVSFKWTAEAGIVQGDMMRGSSLVALNAPPTGAGADANAYIDSVIPTDPNTMMPSAISPNGSPYNYLNILLQNPQFCKRNAPRS